MLISGYINRVDSSDYSITLLEYSISKAEMIEWKHLQLSSEDYENYIHNEDQ
jgi:hypothetical protein